MKVYANSRTIFVKLPNDLRFELTSIYPGSTATEIRAIPHGVEEVTDEVDTKFIPGWIFGETVYCCSSDDNSWKTLKARNLTAAHRAAGKLHGSGVGRLYVGQMDGYGSVSIKSIRMDGEWGRM